ncbi:MAG: hypothetical protein IPK60_24605 [Sandaracinaceae bacterium]|nr:hypothetical protein [Sandaracinaceae bacterium]
MLFALALLVGCEPAADPGFRVGKFAVLRSLVDNNCGGVAMPPADPTSYNVEIRQDGTRGYWAVDDGDFQEGTINSSGAIYFTASSTTTLQAADGGIGLLGCTIIESETISGNVVLIADAGVGIDAAGSDAGAVTTALTATDNHTFTPSPGSNCNALLTAYGGYFDALPCAAHFTITGHRSE